MSLTLENTKETLRNRVRQRLESLGKTPRAVSLAIGANQGYVRDLLDPEKTSIPSATRLQKLAAVLETTTDFLMGRVDATEQPLSEVSFRELPSGFRNPGGDGIKVLGTAYCDDLAVEGEDGGPFKVERLLLETDHVVRLIERPPALWNARDAYGIYFHGASMEPRFYQGEIGIADPRRPPSPGDDVVVQLNDGNGGRDVVTVLVKQLVRATSAYVELRQFNPPHIFRIPRNQVARLHRLIGRNELLGG